MAVYDNKAADELARAKCWHRARGEWQHLPQAEGQALALDPHLYPENQKGQEALVNQGTLAERVDITLPKKINDLDWLNSPNPLFDAQRLFDAGAKPRGPSHDHLRDATRGLA